jgi:hypothetical protein
MPFRSAVQTLIEVFTQAVLYGLYVATLIHCLRWLVYTNDGWKLRDRVDNKPILITIVVIFLCLTVNLVLMLLIQLYFLGDFGDRHSNILNVMALDVISVCICHGWRLDQKMFSILLFPGSDNGGPHSNCRCNSGLSRIQVEKVLDR